MAIKIIKYYIVFSVIFFSWTNFASASLEVTEVNYNPEVKTDHLWIKVYNNDSNDVTLTDWSVADYDGTSWHYHTINADGSNILASNSYTIIAKASSETITAFKTKNPNISDPLFYGNLTIENKGTIGLSKDKKTIISQMSYGGDSTPVNSNPVDNSTNDTNNTSITTVTTNSSSTKVPEILKITTKIISPKIVTAGIPFSLSSMTTTNRGQTYAVGRFVWNFGDGMVHEVKDVTPFDYIYDYPGEYSVTLSYFDNSFNKVADSVDKITLKVVEVSIYISSVGNDSDPFIELENKSNYEIVLSSWIINGGNHYFVIPNGTTILPNKKIKLSPKITGFTGDDIRSVIITNPSKETITTYPIIEKQKLTQKNPPTYAIAQDNVSSSVKKDLQDNALLKDSQVINLNDLGGSAESSGLTIPNSTYSWIGLFIIIGIGVASFWFIKRKNNVDDYVDKEIRAEDMTIVE